MQMNFCSSSDQGFSIIRDVQMITTCKDGVMFIGHAETSMEVNGFSEKGLHRLGDLYSAIISSEKDGAVNLSKEILENGSEDIIKNIYRQTII